MKIKFNILLCIALVLSASLMVACGGGSREELDVGKTVVRISHGQPDGHPDDIAVKAFAEYINEELGEKFKVQVYGNGLLGDSKNALELCQTGAIDYVVSSTSNLESYSKQYGIFSVPYLFNSRDGYFDFMNGKVVKNMYDSTNSSGFKVVTWFDAGTRSFYSNKPIEKPADMKGMKIRVQPSPLNVAMIQALGAGAVPMAYGEVYTALQQGTIDGAENSEMALTSVKHGEVAKYFSYDMHQMQPDMLVANIKFIDNLTTEEKKIFDEATELAHNIELEAWASQITDAKDIAQNQMGVTFVEADVAAFQEACQSVQLDYLKANPEVQIYFDAIAESNKSNSSKDK